MISETTSLKVKKENEDEEKKETDVRKSTRTRGEKMENVLGGGG